VEQDLSLLPNLLGFVVPTIMASWVILRYTLFLIGDWKRSKLPTVITGYLTILHRLSESFWCEQVGEEYKLVHKCYQASGFEFYKFFTDMDEHPVNSCHRCNKEFPSLSKLEVMIALKKLTSTSSYPEWVIPPIRHRKPTL